MYVHPKIARYRFSLVDMAATRPSDVQLLQGYKQPNQFQFSRPRVAAIPYPMPPAVSRLAHSRSTQVPLANAAGEHAIEGDALALWAKPCRSNLLGDTSCRSDSPSSCSKSKARVFYAYFLTGEIPSHAMLGLESYLYRASQTIERAARNSRGCRAERAVSSGPSVSKYRYVGQPVAFR